jgi:hypothetical protein
MTRVCALCLCILTQFRPLAPAAVQHLKATVAEQVAVLGIRSPQTQREMRDMRRKARQDAYEAEQGGDVIICLCSVMELCCKALHNVWL